MPGWKYMTTIGRPGVYDQDLKPVCTLWVTRNRQENRRRGILLANAERMFDALRAAKDNPTAQQLVKSIQKGVSDA